MLHKVYNGWRPVEITPSLDIWELEAYGGAKTMEEYHKINEINMERFRAINLSTQPDTE